MQFKHKVYLFMIGVELILSLLIQCTTKENSINHILRRLGLIIIGTPLIYWLLWNA